MLAEGGSVTFRVKGGWHMRSEMTGGFVSVFASVCVSVCVSVSVSVSDGQERGSDRRGRGETPRRRIVSPGSNASKFRTACAKSVPGLA
eukprot:3155496-Rhodomonas_salina.3